MPVFRLRPASLEEAPALSDLCMISKAYWGYDAAFMTACRKELTIGPADFETSLLHLAEQGDRLAGMAQLSVDGEDSSLEKLFVHPDCMGSGLGRALFEWAAETARAKGAKTMSVEADPGAVPFYRRMGAQDDGEVPSGSIAGRFLPRLRVDL